jgi:predicted CoA-binding protein
MPANDAYVRQVLKDCTTIAVVGISTDPLKPSHYVARYMQERGYRVVPVNPRYEQVLGETCYARLQDIPFAVDMVNVFRRTEDVMPVAQDAAAIGAKCLWQQIGVLNHQAVSLARASGMDSVMDRCLKVEHARLIGHA